MKPVAVPNFALYGAAADAAWVDLVHHERIPVRSGLFSWDIAPHFHDALIQVLYPTHGGGETFIDDTTWVVRPPCLIVAPGAFRAWLLFFARDRRSCNHDGAIAPRNRSP